MLAITMRVGYSRIAVPRQGVHSANATEKGTCRIRHSCNTQI